MMRSITALAILASVCAVLGDNPDGLSLLQKQAQIIRAHEHFKHSAPTSGMVRLLDFTQATIINNNLGGEGPMSGPEEIRFRNLVQGKSVDLVVTAAAGYKAFNPSRNGILGGNGQINAKSGTSVSLTYSFVTEGTYAPYSMPKFYMTFSDLDERHGGAEKERITVVGYDKYYTNDDLALVNDGSNTATFQSSEYGNYSDNDFSPDSPDPTQLSHAVTYLFENKASFTAVFAIQDHRDFNKGRNVLFSGISQLVFCQEPSTQLKFENSTVTMNNLGGMGPDKETNETHEIRYGGIATEATTGQVLDLIVSTPKGYHPANSLNNGLHGQFGQINLYCGPTENDSSALVTFTVVASGTNTPVVLSQFAFVLFDFDTGLHEQQIEFVDVAPAATGFLGGAGYSSYITTTSTELSVTALSNGKHRFTATKHGTEADNPTSCQNLARETADKSVVFTFLKTASWTVNLGITPSGFNSGRNFMFSGQDMYLMCD